MLARILLTFFILLLAEHPALALTAGKFKLDSVHFVESTKQDHIDWNISYPYFKSTTTTKLESDFNTAINDIIDTEKSTFLSTVYAVNRNDLPKELQKLNNTLTITYEIKLITKQPEPLLSILFDVDSYVIGAAHPNTTHRVFNFNFKTGEPIAIAELFKPKVDFVKPLNKYIAAKLQPKMNKSEKEMVDDNEINYSQWNITKDGLLITMDEFPHVYGKVQVMVPYTVIKPYLNIEGPLSICMNSTSSNICE